MFKVGDTKNFNEDFYILYNRLKNREKFAFSKFSDGEYAWTLGPHPFAHFCSSESSLGFMRGRTFSLTTHTGPLCLNRGTSEVKRNDRLQFENGA